ncbi:hypothetical protein J2S72_000158 [Peptoniphilus koenoeneniae]|uniref:DUF5317 domain-containing protein n=1 Tax=Peptoniphilus koenoeneniae TaxID=507751 RepID=A0ABU0ATQ4_9FIRM|nr:MULTISPECIES: DUF5317 family protein [Peptoniphilus]ERT56777.1 hypothetical protein HMPREF1253_1460 [Peptoniphilus sp. BV3C26]MDQ0274162.1 hypothetical protein [Peptoniphilus koenoeneniae]
MSIELIFLAIILKFIKTKNFDFLYKVKFKYYLLLFLSLSIFIGINFLNNKFFIKNYFILNLTANIFLIIFCFLQKNNFIKILALGIILNTIVFSFNGKMPVDMAAAKIALSDEKFDLIKNGYSLSHGFFENSKLFILSDIIPIPKTYIYSRVISFGDILISISSFLYILFIEESEK